MNGRNIFYFPLNSGIDGGSLKFTLSIQSKNEDDDMHKNTSENVKKWEVTEVKKIFSIALGPDTQENCNNVN